MRYIPETSMLWRLEQEDCRECEASLVHLASSRTQQETMSQKTRWTASEVSDHHMHVSTHMHVHHSPSTHKHGNTAPYLRAVVGTQDPMHVWEVLYCLSP